MPRVVHKKRLERGQRPVADRTSALHASVTDLVVPSIYTIIHGEITGRVRFMHQCRRSSCVKYLHTLPVYTGRVRFMPVSPI